MYSIPSATQQATQAIRSACQTNA